MNATFYASSMNLLVASVKSIELLVRYSNALQKRVKDGWIETHHIFVRSILCCHTVKLNYLHNY